MMASKKGYKEIVELLVNAKTESIKRLNPSF
jgi:hypothetical protein